MVDTNAIAAAIKDIAPMVINMIQTFATLGSIGAAGYFGYKTALTYWVEAKPN